MINNFKFLRPKQSKPAIPRTILIEQLGGGASTPGGGDLLSTNNLSDVADPAAARANLGIVALLADSFLFGNGVATSFVIPHGLGVNRLVPFVIKVSTGDQAVCDINIDSTNITLDFDGLPVPTLNEFRVTVIGF